MKTSYKILILLIIILTALFIYLKRTAPKEKTFRLFHADSLQISRIEIRQGDNYIVMDKENDIWIMKHPKHARVQKVLINNLFRDLINLEISTTVITQSTDDDHRYGLDPAYALQLKLYDSGGNLLDHVHIGNAGNPFDYIRRVGSREIYQTRAKVANVFVPDPQNWFDPQILDIRERDIVRINVRYRKNSYTLTPEAPNWRYTDKRESFPIPIENRAIVRVLNVLEMLFAMHRYDDDNTRFLPLFKDPECVVEVYLRNHTKRTLTFAKLNDSEFLLMLDGDSSVLYTVIFDVINRFTRSAEIFKMMYG